MALIVRHKASGYEREIAAKVPSTPEEVFQRHGTGLPPQPREPRPDRRTHG
jgi:hypothetical protein